MQGIKHWEVKNNQNPLSRRKNLLLGGFFSFLLVLNHQARKHLKNLRKLHIAFNFNLMQSSELAPQEYFYFSHSLTLISKINRPTVGALVDEYA